LVILNADDWGSDSSSTNAILECFAAGATTSASGMVYMRDSERAAEIARSRDIPIGLHVNLTLAFDAAGVPDAIRQRQAALTRRFTPRRLPGTRNRIYPSRWVDSRLRRRDLSSALEDQLREFRRLYGQEPTHVDGHHDVHLCPAVFRSEVLSI